jgi:hypothetical protein
MRKVWVLDTETKGTGAQVVPLEKTLQEPHPEEKRDRSRKPRGRTASDLRRSPSREGRAGKRRRATATSRTPLPPGHVRKAATGEIGRVRSVDASAGTASVHWLREGHTSTVPLSSLSRR